MAPLDAGTGTTVTVVSWLEALPVPIGATTVELCWAYGASDAPVESGATVTLVRNPDGIFPYLGMAKAVGARRARRARLRRGILDLVLIHFGCEICTIGSLVTLVELWTCGLPGLRNECKLQKSNERSELKGMK